MVIENVAGELNILDKPINYIAASEAGTTFSEITPILTFHTQYRGKSGVLYILASALDDGNLMIYRKQRSVGSILSHLFI